MKMLKAYFKDFWRYRYLLYNLISRDFKLKYRRSVLGVVWSVLNLSLIHIYVGSPPFVGVSLRETAEPLVVV